MVIVKIMIKKIVVAIAAMNFLFDLNVCTIKMANGYVHLHLINFVWR